MKLSPSRGVDAVLAEPRATRVFDEAAASALAGAMHWGDSAEASSVTLRRVPVVVCTWRRLARLPGLLTSLAGQADVAVELYLWNNAAEHHTEIVDAVTRATARPAAVHLATCSRNVGGFGRFYWARELAPTRPFVIFVDDDEDLALDAIGTLAGEYVPGAMSSVWAFRFADRRDYWLREQAKPGEWAKYCGTGGMVCDTEIFLDPRLFRCPRRYWFCEDLWLSYLASTALRWRLTASAADVELALDGLDQSLRLGRRKRRAFRHLNVRGGWLDPPCEAA